MSLSSPSQFQNFAGRAVSSIVGQFDARRRQQFLSSELRQTGNDAYAFLLILRLALINITGFAALTAAYIEGWIDPIIEADTTHICKIILMTFLVGLAIALIRAAKVSDDINQTYEMLPRQTSRMQIYLSQISGGTSENRSMIASSLKGKLFARIIIIRHLCNLLVTLGLIGTVVGFIISLGGISPSAATDVKSIQPMVSSLIAGMSIALHTTLVGGVLNIWLGLNYQTLAAGTVTLASLIIERGERHVIH